MRRVSGQGYSWALAVLLPFAACNTETPNSSPCYPGDYVYCACDDGVQGYSRCPTNGADYGPCDCSGIHPAMPPDAGALVCDLGAGKLPLLCPCVSNADCESNDCYLFPSKGQRCTTACTPQNASQVCPDGCTPKNVCMVP